MSFSVKLLISPIVWINLHFRYCTVYLRQKTNMYFSKTMNTHSQSFNSIYGELCKEIKESKYVIDGLES